MARRKGLASMLPQMNREAERARMAQTRSQLAAVRRAEAAQKAYQRAQASDEKERKRLYAESRLADVELDNEDLAEQVRSLEHLLVDSLKTDPFVELDQLKTPPDLPVWDPGPLHHPEPPPVRPVPPAPPSGIHRLSSKAKEDHAKALTAHEAAWQGAIAAHAQRETDRETALHAAWNDHQTRTAQAEAANTARHTEIDELKSKIASADPEGIRSYFGLVLESSNYPEHITPQTRLAYVPESKQLVVEYELPTFAVVPEVAGYKYVKAGDKVTPTSRPSPNARRSTPTSSPSSRCAAYERSSPQTGGATSTPSCSTATSTPSTPAPDTPNTPALSPYAPAATPSPGSTFPASTRLRASRL